MGEAPAVQPPFDLGSAVPEGDRGPETAKRGSLRRTDRSYRGTLCRG